MARPDYFCSVAASMITNLKSSPFIRPLAAVGDVSYRFSGSTFSPAVRHNIHYATIMSTDQKANAPVFAPLGGMTFEVASVTPLRLRHDRYRQPMTAQITVPSDIASELERLAKARQISPASSNGSPKNELHRPGLFFLKWSVHGLPFGVLATRNRRLSVTIAPLSNRYPTSRKRHSALPKIGICRVYHCRPIAYLPYF